MRPDAGRQLEWRRRWQLGGVEDEGAEAIGAEHGAIDLDELSVIHVGAECTLHGFYKGLEPLHGEGRLVVYLNVLSYVRAVIPTRGQAVFDGSILCGSMPKFGLGEVDLLEREDDEGHEQGEGRVAAEDVDIGQKDRLLRDGLSDPGGRLAPGAAERRSLMDEVVRDLVEAVLVAGRRRGDVLDQARLVHLGTPRQSGVGERHPDAAPEVACHVDQRRCVPALPRPQP